MTDAIRTLSIRQPWAWLIASGHKKIENRSWTTNYRGPVLIHAGHRWDAEPIDSIEKRFNVTIPRDLPRGGIVGIAGLCDVTTRSADPYFCGPYGFVLVGAQQLPYMPAKGALGLRIAPPSIVGPIDPAIVDDVRAAIEAGLPAGGKCCHPQIA